MGVGKNRRAGSIRGIKDLAVASHRHNLARVDLLDGVDAAHGNRSVAEGNLGEDGARSRRVLRETGNLKKSAIPAD